IVALPSTRIIRVVRHALAVDDIVTLHRVERDANGWIDPVHRGVWTGPPGTVRYALMFNKPMGLRRIVKERNKEARFRPRHLLRTCLLGDVTRNCPWMRGGIKSLLRDWPINPIDRWPGTRPIWFRGDTLIRHHPLINLWIIFLSG